MPDKDVSLATRFEITKKYAAAYEAASKKGKSLILDQLVELTGWNRDHARQQLRRRLRQPPGRATGTVAVIDRRKNPGSKYSYDCLKVLQHVWAVAGGICGKYLAASMADWLDAMEASADLVFGRDRYSPQVRAELLTISAATIDRHLKTLRDQDPIRGKSTTKPGALLRNSISVRKAGDEVEAEPGFFEVDTVAHCGPSLKGEFLRTVNFTDMHTGWVFTTAIKNNSRTFMVPAFDQFIKTVPFMVTGIDSDNGSEFINHEVLGWSAQKKIFYTRSRPHQKNDQATIESKNNHLVRRYGFYYRYETPHHRELLNQLSSLVCDRLNYFTPTKKPTGYTTDTVGRRARVYDKPRSPYHRLLAAGVLSPAQEAELAAYKASLNVVEIARRISSIQQRLIDLAAAPTRRLERELEYAAAAAMPEAEWIKIDQRRARSA